MSDLNIFQDGGGFWRPESGLSKVAALTFGGVIKILGLTTSLVNDFPPLGSLPLLLLFQFFSSLFSQKQLNIKHLSYLTFSFFKSWMSYQKLQYQSQSYIGPLLGEIPLILISLTLSFFFLSGVMKPFLAFLPAAWASSLARTSAFFLSISACFSSSPIVSLLLLLKHGIMVRIARYYTLCIWTKERHEFNHYFLLSSYYHVICQSEESFRARFHFQSKRQTESDSKYYTKDACCLVLPTWCEEEDWQQAGAQTPLSCPLLLPQHILFQN